MYYILNYIHILVSKVKTLNEMCNTFKLTEG